MKTSEISQKLREQAEDGSATALAALLLARKFDELDERLRNIDGALTEIRNAVQYLS